MEAKWSGTAGGDQLPRGGEQMAAPSYSRVRKEESEEKEVTG
jgi:hypothetical protein